MKAFEKAKWIWYQNESTPDSYGEFYFTLPSLKCAHINLSCDGDYTLFINGKYVASNQYGDYEHYKIYDQIEISDYLKDEENHIGIIVWHIGKNFSRYKSYEAGLIFEVVCQNSLVLSSDEKIASRQSKSYKNGLCKQISSQLGFSYLYDSTKEDGWLFGSGADFSSSKEIAKGAQLYPRPIKKQQNGQAVLGKLIASAKSTHYVYDLGREYVGTLSFKIDAPSNTEINISYGEHLENGCVVRKMGDRDFSIDYISQKGENEYTNHMLRFACRYLEVNSSAPIEVKEISLIPQFYEVKRTGFLPSDPLDSQIYDICVRTLENCMMEHYVDCPWREQCLYAFDSRNQMLCGYYAFENGNRDYARANLLLISKDKRKDGLLSICFPCGIDLTIPSFSLYYIVSLYEYLVHTGDKDLILEVDYKIKEILNTFLENKKDGLISRFEGENHWNFYDWSPHLSGAIYTNDGKDIDPNINLLTIIALKAYKEICCKTGIKFDYQEALDNLCQLVKSRLFDKGECLFFNDGKSALELTNALAILSEILTSQESQEIARRIKAGELISCSLSMKCFVYDALLALDMQNKDYVLGRIREDYAPMIETGTVWETIVGKEDFDGAGSLCHGWSAIPVYYYNKLFN